MHQNMKIISQVPKTQMTSTPISYLVQVPETSRLEVLPFQIPNLPHKAGGASSTFHGVPSTCLKQNSHTGNELQSKQPKNVPWVTPQELRLSREDKLNHREEKIKHTQGFSTQLLPPGLSRIKPGVSLEVGQGFGITDLGYLHSPDAEEHHVSVPPSQSCNRHTFNSQISSWMKHVILKPINPF